MVRALEVSIWSGRRDLNPRPSAWQADALPLSYSRKEPIHPQQVHPVHGCTNEEVSKVGDEKEREKGFEPSTLSMAS
jgi:hypothetical protein